MKKKKSVIKYIILAFLIPSMFFVVITSAVGSILAQKTDENEVDIYDICINYAEITDKYRGSEFEWVSPCREEIHLLFSNANQVVNNNHTKYEIHNRLALASATLFTNWVISGTSIVQDQVNWNSFSNCFSGSDFRNDDYDFHNDSSWKLVSTYLGVNFSDDAVIEIINNAKVIFDYIIIADGRVETAVEWIIRIAEDSSHGYSQRNRYGPDYDCSSLVCSAMNAAGFNFSPGWTTFTMRRMVTALPGWEWIPRSELVMNESYVINGMSNLIKGDILLNESAHTELYIGDGKNVGAHSDENGSDGIHSIAIPGDQTGNEISVTPYWDDYWDGVLRYTGI